MDQIIRQGLNLFLRNDLNEGAKMKIRNTNNHFNH